MTVSCSTCGKEIRRKPREIKDRNYCSRVCMHSEHRPRPNRRTGEIRRCLTCDGEFYATAGRIRQGFSSYCSKPCKGIGSRRAFRCETCGVETHGASSQRRRWCSRICASAARKTGETRSCAQCGKSFYVPRGRASQGEGMFCTLVCHNVHQGRTKTEHQCKMCGATFRWSPSRTASGSYNIKYCSLRCRDADPAVRARMLAQNVALQRRRTTRAELLGYALLDDAGVPYLRQEPFAGKFTPDATIPTARVAVQFDGDYWHDRAGTSTEERIRRRVRLDHSQDAYVRACGWSVLRFWHSDLRDDPEGCAHRLMQHLHQPA